MPRSSPFWIRSLVCAAWLLLCTICFAGCASYGPKTPPAVPALSLSSSTFNFQTVVVGQTATQTLQISNTGNAPLDITALSVSDDEFSFSGPSIPRVVLPSNSLTYTLAFSPTTSGNASATIKITSNASTAAETIALAGTGEKAFADLVITPPAINFGNLTLKTTSTQNVTLQNTGDINMAIQGVTVVGAGFGYSDLSPGFTLAPNQKVTFQVWFTPAVAGPSSATLSLLSSNLSSPGVLDLTGTGVSPTPPPATPAPATQYTVTLTWNASTSQVVGYYVYRAEESGSFSPLNSTPINALTYQDSTVSDGTTYYYEVTAVDSSGNQSAASTPATAVIPSS